jgi:RHS repeat-associated protein
MSRARAVGLSLLSGSTFAPLVLLGLVSCGEKPPADGTVAAPTLSESGLPGAALTGPARGTTAGGEKEAPVPVVSASPAARAVLTALRSRAAGEWLPTERAASFHDAAEGLRPHFAPTDKRQLVAATFPKRPTSPFRIVDSPSGIGVDVTISGARKVDADTADGYVVYRNAHGTGATLLHRALPEGVEDFVSFDTRPRAPTVSYKLGLLEGVAGLRLVSGTLELLDAGGVPRLRVDPPYIIGADGARTEAVLAVKGCAFDKNPAGPWGRPVTAPGAKSCTLRVSWDDDGVSYPAVLDPKWTSTSNNMAAARQDHTATLLSTGKVLVVGGRSSGTTALNTADLFDPATDTWSPTGGLGSGGRFSHTATQLNTGSNANTSGKVMIAGGINGTTIANSWQLYTVTGTGAGTWSTAQSSIGVARHQHTATLLSTGNVLIAGGTASTGVVGSAAIYNPGGTGNGSWTAVSTNMAARRFHTATLLNSGGNTNFSNRVLFLGGNSGSTNSVNTWQLFNPSNSTWSTATALPSPGAREGHTATKLVNGNVLIAGGRAGTAQPMQDSFVFTIPASGSAPGFSNAGGLRARRWAHTATLLQTGILGDGQVLLAGGSSDGTTSINSAEVWNGTTTWTLTTALVNPRRAHTATLLANGKVLIAGGINSAAVSDGQVYDPSLGIACTTGTQCASGFCVNGVCCDSACNGQCQACNVTGAVGTCSPKPNNPACNDANACTSGETCQSNGTCGGGTTVTCTAGPCQDVGACVPATGCPAPTNKPNGATCSDANACTSGETCNAGACGGGTAVTCTAAQCRIAGTCDPMTGCPTAGNQPNGAPCDDGDACTTNDACNGGSCQGGPAFTCAALHTCQSTGTCDINRPLPTPPSMEDLLAWWKLDGNGEDATPGNHDLTNEGAVPEAGRSGMAMRFDGSACMRTPIWDEARMQGASGLTIMAWINPDVYVCDQQFDMNTVAGRGWDYSIGAWCYEGVPPWYGQGVAGAVRSANPVGWGYGGGYNSGLGWHHLAFTWDRETGAAATFLDGKGIAGGSFPGEISDYDPFAVGCLISTYWGYEDVMNHFHGAVDEVMLYRRPLSSQDIAKYYADSDPCAHDTFADGTACSDNNLCTPGDTCSSGTCVGGPPITCTPFDSCHEAPACIWWAGCHPHTPAPVKPDGTACNDGNASTEVDSCSAGVCVGAADPATVLGFEAPGRWSVDAGGTGTIVGLDANRTQGNTSLEVTAQNSVSFTSVRMGSLGTVGPLALLDILLPTPQANPTWFGNVELIANAPSVGINNASLGVIDLLGLPLATWQTLAFRLTDDQVTRLSGSYTDLTVTINLTVPANQTGHYLFDHVRFSPDIHLTLQGIAKSSANVTKAIFTYTTTSPSTSVIYGRAANSLSSEDGFIHAPLELPPQQFVAASPPQVFVATLSGTLAAGSWLTWKVGTNSVTATHSSTLLPTAPNAEGGTDAILPGDRRIPLDTVPLPVAEAIVPSDVSYTPADQQRDFHQPNPIGPTSSGTLPGSFQTTDDGAAEYVIPIETPPGRNGVEPKLSLMYNSRSGTGSLGPGWSLRGLHRISRCKTTYAHANERGEDPSAVNYTTSDGLCFDGERLIPVGPSEYRTKRDIGSKFVVTSSDSLGPISFQVYRRDGLIEHYGLGSNSRLERQRVTSVTGKVPGQVSTTASSVRTEWLLAKVTDRYANAMTIRYKLDFDNVFINGPGNPPLEVSHTALPETIDYTSNDVTLRSATKRVRFSYSPSPKAPVRKAASGVLTTTGAALLTSIVVSAPDPVKSAIVSTYELAYEQLSITQRPLLTRIKRCGRDGICMQPTLFSWEPGSYDFRHVPTEVNDFHRADFAYDNPSVRSQIARSRVLVAGDFNSDGYDDILYRTTFLPVSTPELTPPLLRNTRLKVRFGQASGFGAAVDTAIATVLETADENFEPFKGNIFSKPTTFDINGDGRLDLALDQRLDLAFSRVLTDIFLNDGAATFGRLPQGLSDGQFLDPELNAEAFQMARARPWPTFLPADINGDGRVDVTRMLQHGDFAMRPNVNGVLWPSYLSVTSNGAPIPWNAVTVADVDGDGRTEVLMGLGVVGSPNPSYGVHHSVASSTKTVSINLTGVTDGYGFANGQTLDVNGDGLADMMVTEPLLTPREARMWTNLGRTGLDQVSFLPVSDANPDFIEGLIVDLNSDGMDDVLVPTCGTTAGGPPATAYISKGDGTFTAIQLNDIPSGAEFPADPQHGLSQRVCPHVVMDVDGDGQKDYVQSEVGSDVLHIYFRDGKRPDRITSIVNGIGGTTTIEYGRDGLETGGVGCQYPRVCAGRAVDVVRGYTVSEGRVAAGQSDTTRYSMQYSGSVADALGGEWLGFINIQKRNERTLVTETKAFDFDPTHRIGNWYPFVGLPIRTITTYPLGTTGRRIVRQRKTTYTTIASNPADPVGPHSVQIQSIDEREIEHTQDQQFDESTAQRWTIQNYTYDAFANVKTHETVGVVTNTRDFVEYSLTNDANLWLIGKIDRITTTSTSSIGETDQRVTTFVVNGMTGAVDRQTVQPGDPTLQLETSYTRNTEGMVNLVVETPAAGDRRTTRIDYDAIEGTWPAAFTNALGQTTRVAHHGGLGVPVVSIDPNGVQTRWQYDGFGRRKSTFDPSGMSASTNYLRPDSNMGLIVSWTDSTGRTGALTTDNLGREILRTETGFDGINARRSTRVYDAGSGKPQFVSRPFGARTGATSPNPAAGWTFTYDELGRLTSTTPPSEPARTFAYDRLKTIELEGGIEKRHRVEDGLGRVLLTTAIEPTSTAPNNEIQTRFEYGPFSNLRHVYLPGGSTVTMSYDHLGNRTAIADPDAGNRVTTFNAFGEVENEQLPGQTQRHYDRDLLGRVVTVTSGDGIGEFQWDTAANGVGQLDSALSPFGVATSYRYHSNGLIAGRTWNLAEASFAFDWDYDASGRPRTITYPNIGGERIGVTLGYGADGQVASLSSATGALLWSRTAVADDGQLYTESFGNGLFGLNETDPLTGRVTHVAAGSGAIIPEAGGGSTFQNAVQSLGYRYYPDGKLQNRTDVVLGASEDFSYDNLNRVTTWSVSSLESVVTYGYDDSGNLRTRQEARPGATTLESYGYGGGGAGPHAVTSGPAGSYTYDAAGRQTARPGQPLLTYTSFDLPTRIQASDGTSVTFSYSALGKRVRKLSATSDIITLEGLYEKRIKDGATTHVLYLQGAGRVVGQLTCDASGACGEPSFYHSDRLGTIDTVTTGPTVTGRQKRDPFGRMYSPATFSDPSSTVSLGFTGRTEDRDIGLVNLDHRLYDATLGRFISPDPLVKSALNGQDYNRYTYARNNPLSYVDPAGLQAQEADPTAPPGSILDIGSVDKISTSTDRADGGGGFWFVTHYAQGYYTVVGPDGRVHAWQRGPVGETIVYANTARQIIDKEVPRSGKGFADSTVSVSRQPDPGEVAVNAMPAPLSQPTPANPADDLLNALGAAYDGAGWLARELAESIGKGFGGAQMPIGDFGATYTAWDELKIGGRSFHQSESIYRLVAGSQKALAYGAKGMSHIGGALQVLGIMVNSNDAKVAAETGDERGGRRAVIKSILTLWAVGTGVLNPPAGVAQGLLVDSTANDLETQLEIWDYQEAHPHPHAWTSYEDFRSVFP